MDKENSLILPAPSHRPGQHSSVPRGNSPAWATFPCWEKNRVSDNFPQPFNVLHKWPALVSLPPLYGVDEKLRELRTKKSSNSQYQPRGRSDHNCLCIALQKTQQPLLLRKPTTSIAAVNPLQIMLLLAHRFSHLQTPGAWLLLHHIPPPPELPKWMPWLTPLASGSMPTASHGLCGWPCT